MRIAGQIHRFKQGFSFIAVFLLVTSTIIGCGYTTHSVYSGPYKSIFVEPFTNKIDLVSQDAANIARRFKTYHPLLETDLRTAVINRFMYDGGLRIAGREQADLILKGELIDYRRDALRYENNQEQVAEYRLNVVMHITLLERSTGKIVWDEPGFTGEATYFTSGLGAKTESAALDIAISDLAKRVIERLVENW